MSIHRVWFQELSSVDPSQRVEIGVAQKKISKVTLSDVCVFFFLVCFQTLLHRALTESLQHQLCSHSARQFLLALRRHGANKKKRGNWQQTTKKKKPRSLFSPPLKGEFTTYEYFLMLHLHAHRSHCFTLDMKRGRCHSWKQDKPAPLRYSLQHYCSSGELHCTRTLLGPSQKAQFQYELCRTHDNLAGLTVRLKKVEFRALLLESERHQKWSLPSQGTAVTHLDLPLSSNITCCDHRTDTTRRLVCLRRCLHYGGLDCKILLLRGGCNKQRGHSLIFTFQLKLAKLKRFKKP